MVFLQKGTPANRPALHERARTRFAESGGERLCGTAGRRSISEFVSGAGDAYRIFFSRFRSENETTGRPETEQGGVAYEKIVKAKGFRTFSFTICQYIRVLLFLMTVLAQTFLPLVRSHLMTLMLLSVWHSP